MRGPVLTVAVTAIGVGCALAPSARERHFAERQIEAQSGVASVVVGCETGFLAASALCADVTLSDGRRLRFEGVGYRSFGPAATSVLVTEAGGLAPRVRSCNRAGVVTGAELRRGGLFGHHFSPGLLDLGDALRRHQEVMEEFEFWPRCPQFWDVQDERGVNHRYCAQPASAPPEAPPPPRCT